MRNQDYHPIVNTVEAIQTVIDSARFDLETISTNKRFAGLLLDDAHLLFDEYRYGYKANKWDRTFGNNHNERPGFESERISVLWCIADAHERYFHESTKEELLNFVTATINSLKKNTWRESFSEGFKANILCFFLDILNGIKEIPVHNKSKTAA